MFKRNPKKFLQRFVTVDETWIHRYTLEMKEQSKQWTKSGEFASKKAKTVPSAGKIMATVFWDSRGIIFTDYLEKGRIITGQYYADLLDRFDAELKKKTASFSEKKKSFIMITHQLIPQLPWQNWSNYATNCCLIHPILQIWPPAISIYFQTWKNGLTESFASNEEVIAETEAYFKEFDQSYFLNGIKMLEYRWAKCIELKGDYVEK